MIDLVTGPRSKQEELVRRHLEMLFHLNAPVTHSPPLGPVPHSPGFGLSSPVSQFDAHVCLDYLHALPTHDSRSELASVDIHAPRCEMDCLYALLTHARRSEMASFDVHDDH